MIEDVLIAVLITFGVIVLVYFVISPYFSGEIKSEARVGAHLLSQSEKRDGQVLKAQKMRRTKLDEALKDVGKSNQNSKNPPISMRIEQAGLDWDIKKFYLISAGLGFASFTFAMINGNAIYIAVGLGIISGVGTPRFFLNYMKKRRIRAFTEELPNAIDIIVRGVKAGLPINDSIRIVASEVKEPVRSEFLYIMELQQFGLPLGEAVQKLPERMPTAEANFFAIAVNIQQKAGGSISEVLSNLSKVLRERKKLKNRVVALSQEAKSSAKIIGSLPILLSLYLWMAQPSHMDTLFQTKAGNMMLVGSALLMMLGAFIMHKMINIEV